MLPTSGTVTSMSIGSSSAALIPYATYTMDQSLPNQTRENQYKEIYLEVWVGYTGNKFKF